MSQAVEPKRKTDWAFWALSGLTLLLLVLGLLFRVAPASPESVGISLDRSLIPPRYLDLVGFLLFFGYLYVGWKRREIAQLRELLAERDGRAQDAARQLEELSAIFEVSSRISTFRDLEESLEFIARSAKDCLAADRACVFLSDGELLSIRAAAGQESNVLLGTKVALGGGVAGWVGLHMRPLLLNTRRDVEAFFPQGSLDRGVSSALCVPLILKGESLGALTVTRFTAEGQRLFDERQLKILGIFADYAANAINGLRMYRDVAGAHSRLERSYRQLKEVQDQLIQSERMAAVGQLIAEVSHELGNPLTTAVGYAQLLTRINKDPEIANGLATIQAEGMRCQRVVGNLLDFVRKNKGERTKVNVNSVISATLKLRAYQMGVDQIDVQTELGERVPSVLADASRLQQVLLNLLNNARDAVLPRAGGGGTIRFESFCGPDGKHAVIRVVDNGPGIPEGLEEKIFTPFFSTKAAGRGTGLGLSICRGILEDFGGTISAGRAPGGGACFRIELPAAECADAAEPMGEEAAGAPPARGLSALIVDGDERVRGVLERALRLDGHRVVAAADAAAALEQVAREGADAVLTEIALPGMTGLEFFREVERRQPALARRFVFFNGSALREEDQAMLLRTGRPCLRKPFDFAEVRRALAQVAETSRAPAIPAVKPRAPVEDRPAVPAVKPPAPVEDRPAASADEPPASAEDRPDVPAEKASAPAGERPPADAVLSGALRRAREMAEALEKSVAASREKRLAASRQS